MSMFIKAVSLLVQWIAISLMDPEFRSTSLSPPSSHSAKMLQKNHWMILNEVQASSEELIESILPQACNIIIHCDSNNDMDVFNYFENILAEKCSHNLILGMRVCNYIKVTVFAL